MLLVNKTVTYYVIPSVFISNHNVFTFDNIEARRSKNNLF